MKSAGTGISEGYIDKKSRFIDFRASGRSEKAFGDP
jgi:hypothetical protein